MHKTIQHHHLDDHHSSYVKTLANQAPRICAIPLPNVVELLPGASLFPPPPQPCNAAVPLHNAVTDHRGNVEHDVPTRTGEDHDNGGGNATTFRSQHEHGKEVSG